MSRSRWLLISLSALWLASAACAKLVGITDTPVTRQDGSPDASSSLLGGSGGAASNVAIAPLVAGAGGVGGSGGSAPGAAGSGGSAAEVPVSQPDAGVLTDASAGACPEAAARCTATGRELCSAGVWQAEACPLNAPACEGEGQCVVRGPALVNVGGSFLIDATEVTVAQYGLFLAAKAGDVSGQRAACSWNQSYYDGPVPMDPDNFPQTSVDWCDATAYCAWAGEHLCGHIGGGPIARADIFDEALGQWFVACGGGGFHPNSNPDTPGSPRCNSGSGALAPVASFATCEGFYPGVFDMEGNAAEWVDSCAGGTGASDVCYLMGGGIFDNGSSYCDEVYGDEGEPYHREDKAGAFGFRCCSG
jgi:sulfatase modifying factor 1